MKKLQTQGVHHITIVGADRQTSIDFWEGLLGMPIVFEQPNLDNAAESHLYFDPGDGRLVTVFTNEERMPDPSRVSREPGNVQHLAFALSQARCCTLPGSRETRLGSGTRSSFVNTVTSRPSPGSK